jgi:hypothetical protein
VVACSSPETITETLTEAEFNAKEFPFREEGLVADFQPGKIVLTGEIEGVKVVAEMTVGIADNGENFYFQLQRITVGGQEMPPADYADLSIGLAKDIYVPEDGYAVTDVTITDNEMTIINTLK